LWKTVKKLILRGDRWERGGKMSDQRYVEFDPEIAGIVAAAEGKKGGSLTTMEFRNLITPILEKAFARDQKHTKKHIMFRD
jgi:hypothetical protein